MTRLIDADELKRKARMLDWLCNIQVVSTEDIDNTPTAEIPDLSEYEGMANALNTASELLHKKRPTGEWIRTVSLGNGNAHYECSNCHYGDEHAESQEVPYCWHCGARMRGEEPKAVSNDK